MHTLLVGFLRISSVHILVFHLYMINNGWFLLIKDNYASLLLSSILLIENNNYE